MSIPPFGVTLTHMQAFYAPPRPRESPLQRAKGQEKIAGYGIALIFLTVAVMLARALVFAAGESSADQSRLLSTIVSCAEFIVTLATLALIRHQISVSVRQIEQQEATQLQIRHLTEAIQALTKPPSPSC